MRARLLAWIAVGAPVAITLVAVIAVTFTGDTIR